jgi:hypothetical protein
MLAILGILVLVSVGAAGGFLLARRGQRQAPAVFPGRRRLRPALGQAPGTGASSPESEAPSLRARLARLERDTAEVSDAAAAQAIESFLRSFLALHQPELEELKPSQWAPWLRRHGQNRQVQREAADVQRLVEDLDFLRRAPQLSDNAALRADLLRRCRALGRRLER